MIAAYRIRDRKKVEIGSKTILGLGDIITLSFFTDPTFNSSKDTINEHFMLISPYGTIILQEKVLVNSSNYQNFYSFKIPPNLYSGVYILLLEGDFTYREKVIIKTNKFLLQRLLFSYKLEIHNQNSSSLSNLLVDFIIPPNIAPIQQVTRLETNYHAKGILTDKEGNKWLRFVIPLIHPQETITLAYRALVIVRLIAYDVTPILRNKRHNEEKYQWIYEKYTQHEPHLESNHPLIREMAMNLNAVSTIGNAIEILNFVRTSLQYRVLDQDYGAAFAIENGFGDCTEFASLFVSICRAANIPARLVTSLVQSETGGWGQHAQAEFFSNGFWWPIDPTLQKDKRYLSRDPETIILRRGNTLKNSHNKEIRLGFDELGSVPNPRISWDWEIITDNQNRNNTTPLKEVEKDYSTLRTEKFRNIKWQYKLGHLDLEKPKEMIEIKAKIPSTVPASSPFRIPIRLINKNRKEVSGTLRISFNKGAIYTNHLEPCILDNYSNYETIIQIPSHNFLGKALIEIIFQNENGAIMGYEQQLVKFQ